VQSRPEFGTFQPYIIPCNTSPDFFLWDKGDRDRVALIRQDSSTIWTVPSETRNVAISQDDKFLVLLTVKKPAMLWGHHKYTLQWTRMVLEREGTLAIESHYEKHQFGFKGTPQRWQASLVIFNSPDSTGSVALIAFSNGFVEQVRLT
jgi:hypothetical protein